MMILRGTIFSRSLEMDTSITVVGPDTYRGEESYKVVYLLHGLCGGANSWADNTRLPYYARDLGALFVMPEAGRSFYTDLRYGQRFFSYVCHELPKLASRLFNISSKREDTAVMGGSMGGFGALKCAFTRPDFFGTCCAFAPACLFLPEQLAAFAAGGEGEGVQKDWQPNEQIKRDFIAMFGEKMELGAEDDLSALAAAVPAALRPRLYFSCGSDDGFLPDVRRFSAKAAALGFDSVCDELPGGHNWRFFDAALEKALIWHLGADFGEDQGRYKKLR